MAEVSVSATAGPASEEATEQQMYQAMAEKMQAGGMDVTASEIEKLVEDQQADDPPRLQIQIYLVQRDLPAICPGQSSTLYNRCHNSPPGK